MFILELQESNYAYQERIVSEHDRQKRGSRY